MNFDNIIEFIREWGLYIVPVFIFASFWLMISLIQYILIQF